MGKGAERKIVRKIFGKRGLLDHKPDNQVWSIRWGRRLDLN